MDTFRKIKLVNFVLSLFCFVTGLGITCTTFPCLVTFEDKFFLCVTGLGLLEASIASKKQMSKHEYNFWKCLWLSLDLWAGILLVASASRLMVQDYIPSCYSSNIPKSFDSNHMLVYKCQYFELKILVGLLFILNGLLLFIAEPRLRDGLERVDSTSSCIHRFLPALSNSSTEAIDTI